MRTTIELTKEQRAELLRLAAKRGLKGFSYIIQEALDEYLKQESQKLELIGAALGLKGAFQGKAAEEFEERTQELRSHWR
ncbi:ribbon-helix-helix protein, CopG family [Bdellovibrionota bacterium FG-1]